MDGCVVERRRWTERSQAAELAQLHIALAPLSDGEWERGKCAYKVLQYGCTSLPVVGNDVGVTGEVLRRAGGVVATSEKDWLVSLDDLITNRSERLRLGGSLRRLVHTEYSYQAWWDVWSAALQAGSAAPETPE